MRGTRWSCPSHQPSFYKHSSFFSEGVQDRSAFPKSRGVVLQACLINQSKQKKRIWGDLCIYVYVRICASVQSQSIANLRAISDLQHCPCAESAQNPLGCRENANLRNFADSLPPATYSCLSPSWQFPFHCTSTITCRAVPKAAP